MPITKEDLDKYLTELAKEFRRRNGKKTPAEIILIGGASVVINYGFREITYDMDAIIDASASMKDAINAVGDRFGLPNGWLNDDFKNTVSYTPRIVQYSNLYRTFSNLVSVRTVSGEYLVAMKVMKGRQYKHDRSDIIGILLEQDKAGNPLTIDSIKRAVCDLYDSYDVLTEEVRQFIENTIRNGDYEKLYDITRQQEKANRDNLIEYQENKPGVTNKDNVDDIIEALRKRKKQ